MNWRDIPSLAALRAFEATARGESFSAAARELNVTHAAIAQHVRALEAEFDTTLVQRAGQGMALTPEGAQLAAKLGDAFGTIAEAVESLRQVRTDRPVTVSLTPSFAESWLMPRLGGFWHAHPEIEVALHPSMALTDLRRDGIDLAIRFGTGDWPGLHVQPFLASPFVVVSSPGFAGSATTLAELGDPANLPWFFAVAAKEQKVWGEALGLDFDTIPFRDVKSNALAQAAIREGYGLSIQARSLVERDLKEGRMVMLGQGDSAGLGYSIVTSSPHPGPKVACFIDWLKAQAAENQPSAGYA